MKPKLTDVQRRVLLWVADHGSRILISMTGLKLREKELVAALAQFTSTGRGRALSEVPRVAAKGRR